MTTAAKTLDVAALRAEFPILAVKVRGGKPLVYLDNAATTQKPLRVLEAVDRFYRESNANVHRGVHALSERATLAYEAARQRVARFLGAASEREVIFTRGTTEAVNLVAASFGASRVRAGDEIVVSGMEHHSDIVPWQLLAGRTGAKIVVWPIDERGQLDLADLDRLLTPRTKILAVAHVSNALGTVNPIREICRIARERGVAVLVDGAQGVLHRPVDVIELGCDFYAFSGHKAYGPTGIGALWGRLEHLESMPPWQGGGDMILDVTFERTTYAKPPQRFEAGTPNIAGAVGLAAALDWLEELGLDAVAEHEKALLDYGTARLLEVPEVKLVGTADEKAAVLSFLVDGIHPHDVGTVVDSFGVAVRAGHHCAQPVMQRLGVTATTRASLAVYNTTDDLDRLIEALRHTIGMFR